MFAVVDDQYFVLDTARVPELSDLPPGDYSHEEFAALVALFVLSEKGFYTPAEWGLTLLRDPNEWFNATLTTLYAALKPLLPAA